MPVKSPARSSYHPTKRRELVAVADVRLLQAQVIDDKGAIRNIVVWQCGEDGIFANHITDFSNPDKVYVIPPWLKTALRELPANKQLTWDGTPKGKGGAKAEAPAAPAMTNSAGADDDLPGFQSA